MSMLTVYIGHDPREQLAYDVCYHSISRRVWNDEVKIVKLSSLDIPEFTRPKEQNQSTDFTYTRFMVPYLNNYEGYAMFVDCDFIFLDDPLKILKENQEVRDKPVSVCKHPQYIPNSQIKMDGIQQHSMPRKNWASLIMFNCSHAACKTLTPEYVNTCMPGKKMHQLDWVHDNYIGSIPLDWNCLDGYYHLDNPRAIHYTDGGPWFQNYRKTFYSDKWYEEYNLMVSER